MNIALLITLLFLVSTALFVGLAYLAEIIRKQFLAIKALKTLMLISPAQPPAYSVSIEDSPNPPRYSIVDPAYITKPKCSGANEEAGMTLITQAPSSERSALLEAIQGGKTLRPAPVQPKAPNSESDAICAAIKGKVSLKHVEHQPKAPPVDPLVSALSSRIDGLIDLNPHLINAPSTENSAGWLEAGGSSAQENTHTLPADPYDSGHAGSPNEYSRPASPAPSVESAQQLASKTTQTDKRGVHQDMKRCGPKLPDEVKNQLGLVMQKRQKGVYGSSSSESSSDGWSTGDEGLGGHGGRQKALRTKKELNHAHSKHGKAASQQPK